MSIQGIETCAYYGICSEIRALLCALGNFQEVNGNGFNTV